MKRLIPAANLMKMSFIEYFGSCGRLITQSKGKMKTFPHRSKEYCPRVDFNYLISFSSFS
jgi:hypothetical protein